MTCGWFIIQQGQTFWISSNRPATVGPRNGVVAAASAGAEGGEGRVGAYFGSGAGVGAGAISGAGDGDGAHTGATRAIAPSCADYMLLYPWPNNGEE